MSRKLSVTDVSCGNSAWSMPIAVLAPLDVMRLFSGSRPPYCVSVPRLCAASVMPSALAPTYRVHSDGASYESATSRSFQKLEGWMKKPRSVPEFCVTARIAGL